MRPCHRAKGNQLIGTGAALIAVPIGSADQETALAHAVIAPTTQQRGKSLAGHLRAAFVQRDAAVTLTGQPMRFR